MTTRLALPARSPAGDFGDVALSADDLAWAAGTRGHRLRGLDLSQKNRSVHVGHTKIGNYKIHGPFARVLDGARRGDVFEDLYVFEDGKHRWIKTDAL